jgi:glucuronate isomerase
VADHGLETFPAARPSTGAADDVFRRVRSGGSADPGEAEIFRAALLPELCAMNCERGWVQQFHFGIMRNINSGYSKRLGRDSGFDAIGDFCHGPALAAFLDSLERRGRLARTVLYPANPADHAMTITVAGAFQGGGLRGRMQTGSAWWFLDHISGIEEQLERLSSMGLLSVFIGMTTDSRSLLSFSRHEYFRRILCNILGRDMEKGIIPPDMALVGGMVEDICFGNAADYFGFSRLME